MTNRGYIRVDRRIRELPWHPAKDGRRPWTKFEAYMDLLLDAAFKETVIQDVVVKRGELLVSMRRLATRWNWSKNTVKRFLDELEKTNLVGQKRTQLLTHLTICGYEDYENRRDTSGVKNGTRINTYEETMGNTGEARLPERPSQPFLNWLRENAGVVKRIFWRTRSEVTGNVHDSEDWVREEIPRMVTWLDAHPDRCDEGRDWSLFMREWLRRNRRRWPNELTPEEENNRGKREKQGQLAGEILTELLARAASHTQCEQHVHEGQNEA